MVSYMYISYRCAWDILYISSNIQICLIVFNYYIDDSETIEIYPTAHKIFEVVKQI